MNHTKHEKAAIAKRFREFRKKNLMTQRELASFLGLSGKEHISRIENGHHTPYPITLRRFAVLEQQAKMGNTKFKESKGRSSVAVS